MDQIKIDDFLKYKYISSFKANQEQDKACFIIGKANYDKNEYHYELHTLINEKNEKNCFAKKRCTSYLGRPKYTAFPT